jgi:hypothetical protein
MPIYYGPIPLLLCESAQMSIGLRQTSRQGPRCGSVWGSEPNRVGWNRSGWWGGVRCLPAARWPDHYR